jgi:competence protein ComEC
MNRNVFYLITLACILTIVYSIHQTAESKIVFCDVGQGAATFIQMGTYQVIIDTGPDQRILSCIGKYIPFFDRTIEMVIISHNQKDHNGGLFALQNKYSVEKIYGSSPKPSFLKKTQFTDVTTKIQIQISSFIITIFKASQSSNSINDSAIVTTIKTPHHTIFLTSDINGRELKGLLPQDTTILEVPHHGSKYGLYPDSLDLADPQFAVISVGKKNTYGHPSKDVLDILKAKKIKIWRTDEQGELVIKL